MRVGRVVVNDRVDIEIRRDDVFDGTQEPENLPASMERAALRQHFAGKHIRGSEQGCRAVPLVVMGNIRDMAKPYTGGPRSRSSPAADRCRTASRAARPVPSSRRSSVSPGWLKRRNSNPTGGTAGSYEGRYKRKLLHRAQGRDPLRYADPVPGTRARCLTEVNAAAGAAVSLPMGCSIDGALDRRR